jgi:processive 1,2-diacylglycerol beta-glucosyltransferase
MAKKKIVYITAAMGGGHNSAVQATMEAIESNYPGKFDHEVIDIIGLIGKNLEKVIAKLYETSVNRANFTFRAFFDITDQGDLVNKFDANGYQLIKRNLRPILEARPSLIISCYPFLSHSIKRYLKEHHADVPYLTLLTDTGEVHSAWINGGTDVYFAPTEETGYFLAERGIPKEHIQVLGFPVKQLFYKNYNKKRLKDRFLIPEHNNVILYFTGAFGSGGIKKKLNAIDEVLTGTTVIVVTGKNEASYEWISKQEFTNQVIPLHYVENVAELMDIADVVITKAGGLSVMETVTMKKPTIVTEVYPGQEEPNAQFIETMGFGYVAKTPKALVEKIQFIFEPTEMKRIKLNYKNYKLNERSDKKIAKFVHDLLTEEKPKT